MRSLSRRTHAWWPRHAESSTPETVGTIELPHDVEGDLEAYGDRTVLVSAAATYAGNGIRINAVAPGIMDTPAAMAILGSAMGRDAGARQYPLPGIGSPGELAELMVWLLSEKAARVTGQVWSMDAGFSTIRPLVR